MILKRESMPVALLGGGLRHEHAVHPVTQAHVFSKAPGISLARSLMAEQ